MDFIFSPWPWYVAGPIIGLTVPLLLILGNKSFGISASLKHTCAAIFPADIGFFKYDWRQEKWLFYFVGGVVGGAAIAMFLLSNGQPIDLSNETISDLKSMGITDVNGLMPEQIFGLESIFSLKGLFFIFIGGFLVGFGTRYGGGCTSGHAIMGLSNLQWPSLVATISFFLGGILMSQYGVPFILNNF